MRIYRKSAVLCSIIALLSIFLFPGAVFAQTQTGHDKIEYRYQLLTPQVSSSSGMSSSTSPKSMMPHFIQEDNNCLVLSIDATNPVAGSVRIIPTILNNSCGVTLSFIQWIYTSTVICGGQSYNGPSNSGSVALAPGQLKTWTDASGSVCQRFVNGQPAGTQPYEISFTLSANQIVISAQLRINYYGPDDTSPVYTFI